MAVYNTNNAVLYVAATASPSTPLGIATASVSLNTELVDVTEIGGVDRSFIAGIRGGSITGSCYYDQGNAVKALVEGAVKSGATLYFSMFLHTSATISGTCIVENWSPEVAVNDAIRASFTLRITGEYTIG